MKISPCKIIKQILPIAYFYFACGPVHSQERTLLQEIDKALKPLDTQICENDKFLPSNLFSDASVIALGESTHGTKEFYKIKDCIIRNQILFNNVKNVAIENEFCGLVSLNDYLLQNDQPLDSLFSAFDQSGMYGIYFTKEVLDMLRWIKTYNLSKKRSDDKVKLFGLDMQDPYSISSAILDHFQQLKKYDQKAYEELEKLKTLYYPRKEVKMSAKVMTGYKNLTDHLSLLARVNVAPNDTLFLLHYIELLKQTISLREGHWIPAYKERRDIYLAKNAFWIQQNFGSNKAKMVIWAHNGHIAHAKLDRKFPMGYYLQSYFKDKYYAVDFVFDEGYARIYDFGQTNKYKPFFYSTSTNKKSIEYVLKKVSFPMFFLDVHHLKTTAIDSFFKENRYQRIIGAEYQSNPVKDYFEMPVLDCFDGLIFIKKANAAESIR